jgi:hypothetical protein
MADEQKVVVEFTTTEDLGTLEWQDEFTSMLELSELEHDPDSIVVELETTRPEGS